MKLAERAGACRAGRNVAWRFRRRGGAWGWTIVVLVALIGGVAGGVWIATHAEIPWLSPATAKAPAASVKSESKQLYTCGMHPNVIQDHPGECPICHMKLTPLKQAKDSAAPAGGPSERKVLYWRAPMDPSYISDKPGKSPMGMDLVPVYAEEAATGNTIRIDPVTVQNMGIRTTTVRHGPLVKTIRTVGRVDYDEQTVAYIDTKFDGWIEKLYVDETGVQIEKGQPLFEVYSPKLYAAQEEYLAALRGVKRLANSPLNEAREQASQMVEAAEVRLRYFDVDERQIDELRRTGQIKKTLTIHSPAGGIVTEKMAQEGMYVKPGMRLFTIADLSRVWVLVDIYEYQLPWVRVGQQAKMTLPYVPGREFSGRVVYIYPYLEKQTRVVKVRLEFANPTLELKPEMYANVMLLADLDRNTLLIPREAYIDSGTRQVAFVALGDGKFLPRDIQVGVEAENGMVEVRYGLDAGDRIVTSGQFLLDAESKLKEAIAKMLERQKQASEGRHSGTSSDRLEGGASTDVPVSDRPDADTATGIPADAKYACPMETHPDQEDPAHRGAFFSSKPGRCDWCGMKLKPLAEIDWVQARLAAGKSEVAYTCPDHQHVFAEHPGTCPRCGRKLEPFKVMYTCPTPEDCAVISTHAGTCPHCGRALTPFRGIWLAPEMAAANSPPDPEVAEQAAYRCPVHPLVHSDRPGTCTICGRALRPAAVATAGRQEAAPASQSAAHENIPADAKYVCPMEECWFFSADPGRCPKCGMKLKPIADVSWAAALVSAGGPAGREGVAPASQGAVHENIPAGAKYVCPMHPHQTGSATPGRCPICGMQLVRADTLPHPATAPAAIATQMNYLMEHYLELQKRFASDSTTGVARNALGLVGAADAILAHLGDEDVKLPPEFGQAVRRLRAAALKTTGKDLDADRVTFVEMGSAMRTLVKYVRPDRKRYPKIYIFHCPMTKGDWLQTSDVMSNPFYGFKMRDCGKPVETR